MKYNCYTCENGHETYTRDLVEGTTPFMIECKTDGCTGQARSSFYQVIKMKAMMNCTHEWYKPNKKKTKRLDMNLKDHVERGGLLLRKID